MDIDVRPVDPADDEAVAVRTAIIAAARAYDVPDFPPVCPRHTVGRLRNPNAGEEAGAWLGYLDGRPAGVLSWWLPTRENLGNAYIELAVAPPDRRRGVGRALYEHAVAQARSRGRVRITADAVAPLPGGPPRDDTSSGFAAAMGAKSALEDVRRRLDLSTVDIRTLDAVPAPGYSVVSWRDHAPGEHLADIGRLDGRLITDAPLGDLVLEPPKVDEARVREDEAAAVARGETKYHTGIRHDASGRLVAWTTIAFNFSVRWHAFQHITIVDPEHRGHRLGLRVKVANLVHTLGYEPELRVVDTWNAAQNRHMIAINEQMGYRPVDLWRSWQHEFRGPALGPDQQGGELSQ
jgi:GNAT superfamily N-acetyltransferase